MKTSSLKALLVLTVVSVAMVWATSSPAQTCGLALMAQHATPAVLQGINLDTAAVACLWATGTGTQSYGNSACLLGCKSLSASPLCSGGGGCVVQGARSDDRMTAAAHLERIYSDESEAG